MNQLIPMLIRDFKAKMNKIFLTILIIILIASTAFFALHPAKIKEVRFFDSSLTIETEETQTKTVAPKITPKVAVKTPVKQKTKQPQKTKAVKPIPQKLPQKISPKVARKAPRKAPIKTPPKPSIKTPAKTVSKPQPVKKRTTAKEETIAWNQWRSNVDNEIVNLMASTKLLNRSYANRIDYSFDVDTAQNISNIKITVSPARAQNEAEPKFRQIISMLNKSAALKFPKGSQRAKVTVKDSVHHEGSGEASNASDYSDYEKVKTK